MTGMKIDGNWSWGLAVWADSRLYFSLVDSDGTMGAEKHWQEKTYLGKKNHLCNFVSGRDQEKFTFICDCEVLLLYICQNFKTSEVF